MYSAFCGNMTTVVKQERAAARIYTINAVANVALNALFIPRYGYVAASVVTVVTDAIGAFQFHLLLSRKLKLPNMLTVMVRVAAAATLMGLALGLANRLHLLILIPLGAAVYGGLVLALRLLDEEEWGLIRKILRKVGLR
jgi:O-antigen/teichoic acid export membrane protein